MPTLRRLLQLHHSCVPSAGTLQDNLLDPLLMSTNVTYRLIRLGCLHHGYRFSSEPDPRWMQYRSYPLLSLPTILADRVVPYIDNVTTLRLLESQGIDLDFSLPFIATSFPKNPLMHEGAHCIANHVLKGLGNAVHSVSEAYLDLLGEAFAFCTFQFCGLHATTRDEILACIVNDVAIITDDLVALRRAVKELGVRETSAVYMATFIYALGGVTRSRLSVRAVCDLAHLSPAVFESPTVSKLIDVGFGLAEGFGNETQAIYFQLVDRPRPTEKETVETLATKEFKELFDTATNQFSSFLH